VTLDVLVDARSLSEWSGQRGIGTYLQNLLAALADDGRLRLRALAMCDPVLPIGVERVAIKRRAPGRLQPLEHELLLPRDLRRASASVVHSPSPDPPRRCPVPWAQTLFDVIPLALGQAAGSAITRRFRRRAVRYADADAVIAISRHAADEGIRLLGLDPRRVHVAHLGVDPAFSPSGSPVRFEPPALLLVGSFEPRKRFEHAFALIGQLADAGYPHRLRVAGPIAPWVASALEAAVAASEHPERIDILGRVDDLGAEYRGAVALLHPSAYEGFGLPLVEAMACGTPVIGYANSAVPEIAGGAAALVPDGDLHALVSATRRVLGDADRRDELVAAGLDRARAFRWSDCARIHADVYLEVARG